MPFLRYIGPLVLFMCFVPYLLSRFKNRDDPVLVKLTKKLDPAVYHLNTNVEIRTKEQTVDIDYVITSRFGVFVIQVKPLAGLVEGQANHVMWTSKRLGKSHRFSNPLKRNREAVAVLRSRYDFAPSIYHSLVIFRGKGKFAGTMPNNVRTQNNFIKYILSKDTEVMDEVDAKRVHKQIHAGAIPNTLKTYSQYLDKAKELVDEYSIRNKKSGKVASAEGRKTSAVATNKAKKVKSKSNVEPPRSAKMKPVVQKRVVRPGSN